MAPRSLDNLRIKIPDFLLPDAKSTLELVNANATKSTDGPADRVLALPPDTTREHFDKAIAALRLLIGDDNVILNEGSLNDGWYLDAARTHDSYHVLEQDDFVCSARAQPRSVEDVQAIVRWANAYLIPIWPISIGRNIGYGGAGPRLRGSVTIDMGHHMKSVLEVNGSSASALLEPGVTFADLHTALELSNTNLLFSCPDLPMGSVIGNSLDRGMGYTPMGDHWGAHIGMEVVLPNGDLIRTGMGAISNSDTWQCYPYGFGPVVDGLFTQSNMGIVTKMGFRLMHKPPCIQSYEVTFTREEDLAAIVDTMSPLMVQGVLGNVPSIRHVLQEAAWHKPRKHWFPKGGKMTDALVKELATRHFEGRYWFVYGALYGDSPETIQEQAKVVKAAFAKVPGSRFRFAEETPQGSYIRTRQRIFSGIPDLKELSWAMWYDNGAHWAFSPVSAANGASAWKQFQMVKARHLEFGVDWMSTFVANGRMMLHILCVPYDRSSDEHKRTTRRLMRHLVEDARKLGFGEYRTHHYLSDQVMRAYDFNNGAHRRFCEALKDSIDPNSIMAPGKAGIWGQRWRNRGFELYGDEERSVPSERKDAKL